MIATITATATLTVTIPAQIEALVPEKVASGRYADPNAVVVVRILHAKMEPVRRF